MDSRFKHIRLLVFDLDGTLIDSRQDLATAVNATLRHFGKPALPTETIASFVGDGALALIERAFQSSGLIPTLVPDAHQHFLGAYRQHKLDHTYVYPGVLAALEAIRRRAPHIHMACLTNKPVAPSRDICRALALEPFFFQIYGGNSFPSKKPDPLGLTHLIAEAGHLARTPETPPVDAAHTAMIGDAPPDILAARAAGTLAVGCRFGFSEQDIDAPPPDALVTSPSEWVELVCSP